ncbi:hypothetical protein [Actinocorallia longicatena]|uniref:Uncharacterized protein n=1 Tax=Actinocorallia longicatena TaxID=111803 RepID=A0ABP6QH61_9ACTN
MNDATNGVRLIGGEMNRWADLAAGRPAAGGPVLRDLVRRFAGPGVRVLVAGPHEPELLGGLLDSGAGVTVMVRSLPDAEELAGSTGAEVVCGALDRVRGGRFDLVVALDGVGRLRSPESAPETWARSVERLVELREDGGTLLLGAENPLGLHRLAGIADADPTTIRKWRPEGVRPSGLGELVDVLPGCGLFLAHPLPGRPAVLCSPASDLPFEAMEAAARTSAASLQTSADPAELLHDALRAGLAMELAAGWVVVVGPGAETLPPALLAADPVGTGRPVVVEVDGGIRTPCGDLDPRVHGRVARLPERLAGLLPAGRSLQRVLERACADHDLPGLRRTLRAYADWVLGLPGQVGVFATPDNVLIGDVLTGEAGFVLADPSRELTAEVAPEEALARVLRHFAIGLLAADRPLPWPPGMGAHELTRLLQVTAGRPADHPAERTGLALEAEILAAGRGLSRAEAAPLTAAVARGEVMGVERLPSHRELLALHGAVTEELRMVRSRARWAERTLAASEKKAARLEKAVAQRDRQIRHLKGSRSFRAGRLVTSPGRVLIRLARA